AAFRESTRTGVEPAWKRSTMRSRSGTGVPPCIDEVGYTPFDAATAGLFFQLVAHRYERASLILTSDRPLGRWDEVFGASAPALADRVAHHAEIVRLDGDSYRTRRATSAWAD
ncbi:ATP-binding protein, partial [Streptomyces sp. NPDC006129]|uniref:ATP-binding protein n=1 Tax=Streptomyces sp. NPDC006129 TaxID=3155348 RepID=UPI0033B2CFF3